MTIHGAITTPIIQAVAGRDNLYRQHDTWACPIGRGRTLIVQGGFMADGGTVPPLAYSLVGHPLQGRSLPGFWAHDALYASELLPRAEADAILHALNAKCGVPTWKHTIFYMCVQAAGWAVWLRHTPASVAAARRLVSIEVARGGLR